MFFLPFIECSHLNKLLSARQHLGHVHDNISVLIKVMAGMVAVPRAPLIMPNIATTTRNCSMRVVVMDTLLLLVVSSEALL